MLYNLAIIGEAASHVPRDIVHRHPDIEWVKMRGMRNVLVHEYFGADLSIVWTTIQEDLPPLAPRLRQLLEAEG